MIGAWTHAWCISHVGGVSNIGGTSGCVPFVFLKKKELPEQNTHPCPSLLVLLQRLLVLILPELLPSPLPQAGSREQHGLPKRPPDGQSEMIWKKGMGGAQGH